MITIRSSARKNRKSISVMTHRATVPEWSVADIRITSYSCEVYYCALHVHIAGLLYVVAWQWCLGLDYVGWVEFMVCVGLECPIFLA